MSDLVRNPEHRFSQKEAHISLSRLCPIGESGCQLEENNAVDVFCVCLIKFYSMSVVPSIQFIVKAQSGLGRENLL